MTDFEMVLIALLIPVNMVLFYIAGRMNLFELLLKMAEDTFKELEEKNNERNSV